jgi:hypothetical protein
LKKAANFRPQWRNFPELGTGGQPQSFFFNTPQPAVSRVAAIHKSKRHLVSLDIYRIIVSDDIAKIPAGTPTCMTTEVLIFVA